MVIAGVNTTKVSDSVLQSDLEIHKEGLLMLIEYTKGSEASVTMNVIVNLNGDNTDYYLPATDPSGEITAWSRRLASSIKTAYPIRLPGRCTSVRLATSFSGAEGEGTLKVGLVTNNFYGL